LTIEGEIEKRGITELLHFTTNRGIVGTLAKGALMSRHRLPSDSYLQHILHVNSVTRPEAGYFFDKSDNWLDYVNLSISEINARFFGVSQRWHSQRDIWWGILGFDPSLMTHDGVVFATTNNSYEFCARTKGLKGFNDLFSSTIRRKRPSWTAIRGNRSDNLPTCEQAEMLYPGEVPVSYLRRIYVGEEDHQDLARGWVREFHQPQIEVVLSKEKFSGKPN
jgi:hypothetical protein